MLLEILHYDAERTGTIAVSVVAILVAIEQRIHIDWSLRYATPSQQSQDHAKLQDVE